MATQAQILTILNILVALHLSRALYKSTLFMQNKPNLSLRRQGSGGTISPYLARRYKNFTRHSVSEGGPIQTPLKPKTKPFFVPKTPLKPKTNPIQTQSKPNQTQSPVLWP
jgi:hypothetical protein